MTRLRLALIPLLAALLTMVAAVWVGSTTGVRQGET